MVLHHNDGSDVTMKRLLKTILFVIPILALVGASVILGHLLATTRLQSFRVYAANVARIDVPTLQEITADATNDAEALDAITAYYAEHRAELAAELDENDETRLRALYAMHIVHISHPYDIVPEPAETLLDYIREQRASHCGTVTRWQWEISRALGLDARGVALPFGDHGWVEVKVNGAWETFDGTTNLWLSEPGERLTTGVPRLYRALYTPLLDPQRPDARAYEGSAGDWTGVLKLRDDMMNLGISYQVGSKMQVLYDSPAAATRRRIALLAPYTSRLSWADAHPDAAGQRGIAEGIMQVMESETWD